jgi:tRNA nucleotidyltransferase (CCA-adding enzyme)
MSAEDIVKAMAAKLQPIGKQETIVKKTVERVNKAIKAAKIKASCEVAGSFAKGVYLENDFDVDLFVRFDLMYRNQNLSNILETILKKVFLKIERVKGSRDYFHADERLSYEIVPVLAIKNPNDSANITDFSPGHVKWVLEGIKKNPKIKDEIKVTKQFLKAQGLYGAESFINGFSGHVVDVLVINYKSFLNLLKAASKWKEQEIIDVAKHYKKNEVLYRLNKSKINNLVLIDPLQKERNAAAALSKENYELFKSASKAFLQSPSEGFFELRKFDEQELRKKYKNIAIIKAKPFKGNRDIVGTKIYKAFLSMKKKTEENGFTIVKADWSWDKKNDACLWFAVKEDMLPETYIRRGPSLKMKQHVMNFKMVHKKTSTKSGKIFAKVKRSFRTISTFLKDMIKNDLYLRDKAMGWKL